MKAILTILIICFSLFSCTDEPDSKKYRVSILNNTTESLNIETYNNGTLISTLILNDGDKGIQCTYNFESFIGYQLNTCQIDSIVFKNLVEIRVTYQALIIHLFMIFLMIIAHLEIVLNLLLIMVYMNLQ